MENQTEEASAGVHRSSDPFWRRFHTAERLFWNSLYVLTFLLGALWVLAVAN